MAEKGFEIIQFGDPIKGAKEGIDHAINETLAEIATQAKALAPVEFGQLKNSIMYRGPGLEGGFNDSPGEKAKTSEKLKLVATDGVGYIGSNLDHAVYQEFGTKNTPPQPFLRPAVASVAGHNLKEIKKVINKEMKKWTEDKAARNKK